LAIIFWEIKFIGNKILVGFGVWVLIFGGPDFNHKNFNRQVFGTENILLRLLIFCEKMSVNG
jgi:hypothetical protein